jgi:hypothetical protein
VFDEVSDESSFRSRRSSLARREGSSESSATRNAGSDVRTELGERFAIRVEVSTFDKLLDARIVSLYSQSSSARMAR